MVTGRKLLLADDSVTIQKVVDLTFTDEGMEVLTVSDGQQALDKLEEFAPDIVLADVFMPRLNGYEVCEYIKRNERFRHIPVMLLVGSFEPFDEAEARRVGADDHLTKPFQSIRTLIGKVRSLLTGGGSAESEEATTRKLAPLPEAEKENRSNPDFLERSTADTAPLPDVHEDVEHSDDAAATRKVSYADLSMDDEMIETKPASDYSGTEQSTQSRPTAQYSAADLKEAGIAQTVEESPTPVQETVSAFTPAPMSESSPVAVSQPQATTRASAVAASDDSLLDLGDIETLPAMAEADDFFLDLLDEPLSQPQAKTPSWAEASAPSFKPSQAREFVEAQVVEEKTQHRTGQEFSASSQPAPTERLPDDYQMEGAASSTPPAEATAPRPGAAESSRPHTGQITLEQLSPEVIDAIARRAVEQLSDRVVEQIAWEVVPPLAELLIKRHLEEEKK